MFHLWRKGWTTVWRLFGICLTILTFVLSVYECSGIKCVYCRDRGATLKYPKGQLTYPNISVSAEDSDDDSDFSCGELTKRRAISCSSMESTCFKHVVFNGGKDGSGRSRHLVSRGCQRILQGTFCDRGEIRRPLSPGLDAVICVCNDIDYCNSGTLHVHGILDWHSNCVQEIFETSELFAINDDQRDLAIEHSLLL